MRDKPHLMEYLPGLTVAGVIVVALIVVLVKGFCG